MNIMMENLYRQIVDQYAPAHIKSELEVIQKQNQAIDNLKMELKARTKQLREDVMHVWNVMDKEPVLPR